MKSGNEPKFFDPTITIKKKLVDEKFQYIKGTDIPLPSEISNLSMRLTETISAFSKW